MTAPKPTKDSKNGTYLVCHHGAGAGGLSFAALAKEIKKKSNGELGVLAFDCRGHGEHEAEVVNQ
jgi:protein phosphatase methylesterase 1